MRIGVYVSTAGVSIRELEERFVELEERGIDTAWVGQIFEHDALTLLALAARVTTRIELGSWVAPLPFRHPVALAQQALTVQAASGGRLALGVGVSHEAVVARRLGIPYGSPLARARGGLAVLQALLETGRVDHEGDGLRVHAALDVGKLGAPTLLLAALGPRLLDLAGARADGAAIWLGAERFLETFAIPRLRAAARRAGRRPPRIACGLPIAVSHDIEAVREGAAQLLAVSSRLPAYRRVMERGGAAAPEDLTVSGDEDSVVRRLDDLRALGVTDFHAIRFQVAGDPDAGRRTLEVLARYREERGDRDPAQARDE